MSYIYLVTNKINGKQYVGQHKYDGVGLDPKYKGSGHALLKAYEKYGIENFKMELLEECADEDLNPLEQLYIEHYNTFGNNGYNLTKGGDGVNGYKMSKEAIIKMSIPINQYNDDGDLVKTYISATDAARHFGCTHSAINNALIKPNFKSNGFRFRYANECNDKIEPYIKPKAYNQKKINQYSLDGEYLNTFESISDVGRIFNMDVSGIYLCCEGKTKSAYGFMWKYYDECYSDNDITPCKKTKSYHKRKINQYSLDGKYIKTWDSMTDIENSLGYNVSNICHCCKGKKAIAYEYMWRYEDECYEHNDIYPYVKPEKYNSKQINQYDINGVLINTFNSASEASRYIGASSSSFIVCCANGKFKTAYGFIWKYADDETKKAA